MKEKTIENLNTSQLIPILTFNSNYEEYPLPFRHMSKVAFRIDFESYLEVIEELDVDILPTSLGTLYQKCREYRRGDDKLKKELMLHFMHDVAFAQLRELAFSDWAGREASTFIYTLPTEDSVRSIENLTINENWRMLFKEHIDFAEEYAEHKGINLRIHTWSAGVHNEKLLRYSIALIAFYKAKHLAVFSI